MKANKTLKYQFFSRTPVVIITVCMLMCCILASCSFSDNTAPDTEPVDETEYVSGTAEADINSAPLSELAESAAETEPEKESDLVVTESTGENMQSLTPAVTDVDFSSIFTLFSQYSYEADIDLYYSFFCKGKNHYHVHIDVPDGIDFPYETDFFGEYDGIKQTYFPYSIRISDDFNEGIIYFYVTFSETEFDSTPDYKDTEFVCSMAVINYRGYYFMMRNYEISDLYNYADEYIYNYEHRQNN